MQLLKTATRTAHTGRSDVVARVSEMLLALDRDREDAALRFAEQLDGWTGDPVLAPAPDPEMSAQHAADLSTAHANVQRFAQHQLASLTEFEVELSPGLTAGQRLIPVDGAGCYVPGGRYAHVASAIMSATTAQVAGVPQIIAASPPRDRHGPHPAVLHALHLGGAQIALCLGGVQGVAALALGLFTGQEAAVVVGPGNAYVAEAKRQLFGRIGIDLYAGPTEVLVIADQTADPELVAADLVGQAEHGPDSPAVLIALSESLARAVIAEVGRQIAALPAGNAAAAAWRDCGEVVLVADPEEAAATADRYASEHLEVHAADLPWWRQRLRSYGSLFLGEQTTVTYGDKAAGPNHILPTMGAARYTGGLSVHKFLKVLTWQQLTPEASAALAGPSARISRLEGMEAHARAADLRAQRYGE